MSRKSRAEQGVGIAGVVMGVCLGAGEVAVTGGHSDVRDWVVALLVMGFVIQPFATLGHELGHALAALLLGARPSLIVVGRGPFLRVRAEPTLILFSLLPTRGVPFAGVCRYDPTAVSWRSVGLIALAGPLATLAELLAVALIAPELWSAGALGRLLTVWPGVLLAISLVVNLWPRRDPAAPGAAAAFTRDGDVARHAFARHRTQAAAA